MTDVAYLPPANESERALVERSARWLDGREDLPEWPDTWQRLAGRPHLLPADLNERALIERGALWLDGREDRPAWSAIWQHLVERPHLLPEDLTERALIERGVDWLHGREDRPYWSHVWLVSLEGLPRVGLDTMDHAAAARTQVYGRTDAEGRLLELAIAKLVSLPTTKDWGFVWAMAFARAVARREPSCVEALRAIGMEHFHLPRDRRSVGGDSRILEALLDTSVVDADVIRCVDSWIAHHWGHGSWALLAAKRLKHQSDDETATRIEQNLVRELSRNPERPIAQRAMALLPGLMEAVLGAQQQPPRDEIIVGHVYEGQVTGVSEQHGAFIEVSGRRGLLRRHRVTDDPIVQLRTLFTPGEPIRVRVVGAPDIGLELDFEVARDSHLPASAIVGEIRVGQDYEGRVLGHHPQHGVFVEIGDERGLVPLRHFDGDRTRDMAARFPIGSLVQVRFVGRWAKGVVLAPADDWIDPEPGRPHVGVVSGTDDSGIWVVARGRRGKIRWRHFDGGPRAIVPAVGDLVQVSLGEDHGNRVHWEGTPHEEPA